MFFGTSVKQIRHIDVTDKRYNEAVLVKVTNGKGTLTHITDLKYNDDYYCQSTLMLNGRPLMQSEYPVCPTCSGLIARGYGIENIDCPELKGIRDRINDRYKGIEQAVKNISPVLGLLDSGYYIVADCPHYPTYGENDFFCNAPDEKTLVRAFCDEYYLSGMLTVCDGTPAYLYPTQSNDCIVAERVEHYRSMIKDKNAPRAVALYDYGFISMLLDGHHKAAAAAKCGVAVPCTVIIPYSGIRSVSDENRNISKYAVFADIRIPLADIPDIPDAPFIRQGSVTPYTSSRKNSPVTTVDINTAVYPRIEELAAMLSYRGNEDDITDEDIEKLLGSDDYDDIYMLTIILMYLSHYHPERGYVYAKKILHRRESDYEITATAMRALLTCRDEETEQLFVNYLVDADKRSPCYDIALSYWEN